MLPFSKLSFWERSIYTDGIDFTIIGAGIVGMSAALHLRKANPNAKIILLERGYLPTGASTKNAGFTCFGSPSELSDDLSKMDERTVWDTVSMRMEGLRELFSLVDPVNILYEACGSWDIIREEEQSLTPDFLAYLNEKLFEISGEKSVYSEDKTKMMDSGFKGVKTAYHNRLEGAIHTGKLIEELHRCCTNKGIHFLFGVNVLSFESYDSGIEIQTSMGALQSPKLLVCTNAFAKEYLSDIQAVRAQVLVTKPITNLSVNGTFHMESGYYYFRNFGNRILFGGGRNLDFTGETSTEFETTLLIQEKLKQYLHELILPNTPVEIDYSWSGIMAVGSEKKPIIQKTNKNIAFGVRMGGMGVAIGASVGKQLSNIFS
jgi:glycine/D-amino acid oxidase-like deaminating enzyme